MNILKYLFDKKYRDSYTGNISESFSYNFDEYEKIYNNLNKNVKSRNTQKHKQSA